MIWILIQDKYFCVVDLMSGRIHLPGPQFCFIWVINKLALKFLNCSYKIFYLTAPGCMWIEHLLQPSMFCSFYACFEIWLPMADYKSWGNIPDFGCFLGPIACVLLILAESNKNFVTNLSHQSKYGWFQMLYTLWLLQFLL